MITAVKQNDDDLHEAIHKDKFISDSYKLPEGIDPSTKLLNELCRQTQEGYLIQIDQR